MKFLCFSSVPILFLLVLAAPPDLQETSTPQEPESMDKDTELDNGVFTGELLPVFYVRDVLKSVAFYRDVLGFSFHHYFDYEAGEQVTEWKKSEPPIWAEMAAGPLDFGLHLTPTPETFTVGGTRHYFQVDNLDAYYDRIKKHDVEIGELVERPWMRMFKVIDPDGHELFFSSPPKEKAQDTQAMTFAWENRKEYIPPAFESFFPDDPEGGKALDALFRSEVDKPFSDQEILDTVRNGLRRTSQHRTLILSWIGNKYVWGQNPQHPYAIEIMYHAADVLDRYGTRHYAVYFGLSVTHNKTPNILKTLVDLYLAGEDQGRIAWGLRGSEEKTYVADLLIEKLDQFEESEPDDTLTAVRFYKEVTGKEPPHAERYTELGTYVVTFAPKATFEPKSKEELLKRFLAGLPPDIRVRDSEARISRGDLYGIALVDGDSGRDRLLAFMEGDPEFGLRSVQLLTRGLKVKLWPDGKK